MPYSDKKKQLEYQIHWRAERRAFYLAEFGGKCVRCGSKEILQFDHINRVEKVDHRIWFWSHNRIREELKKCQLLCLECHRDKTCAEFGWHRELSHGTLSGYTHFKCRCAECKAATSRHRKRHRTRQKIKTALKSLNI